MIDDDRVRLNGNTDDAIPMGNGEALRDYEGHGRKWRESEERLSLDNWPHANPLQRKYLWWLAVTGSRYLARKYCSKLARTTVDRWRANPHGLQESFKDWEMAATEMAVEMMEGYVSKRAREGSNPLLLAWLQANAPEKYGKKMELTVAPLPDKKIELVDNATWSVEPPKKPKEISDGG